MDETVVEASTVVAIALDDLVEVVGVEESEERGLGFESRDMARPYLSSI